MKRRGVYLRYIARGRCCRVKPVTGGDCMKRRGVYEEERSVFRVHYTRQPVAPSEASGRGPEY
jgi:hypothetical protein